MALVQVLFEHPLAELRVIPGQVLTVAPRHGRLRAVIDRLQGSGQASGCFRGELCGHILMARFTEMIDY